MKPITKIHLIILTSVLVFSCSSNINISELQSVVLQDIKSKLESQGGGAEVQSFNLTHVSGNEYVGILETLENGSVFLYTVNVISDGNSFVWEIPTSESTHDESTEAVTNSEDDYANESYEESTNYEKEDHKNMSEAMENISDPTYCSLCKGTGIEENRARGMGLGDDEYGRICPLCNGAGRRSY